MDIEVLPKNASRVRQFGSSRVQGAETLGSCSPCGSKKKVGGVPPEALEPWIHTLLDGQAALALESVVIKDMCTDGREELVSRKLKDSQTRRQPIVWEKPWRRPLD